MARKSKGSDAESEPEDNKANAAEPEEEVSKRTQYIGLGLIASVIVGYSPLRDAIQGNGSFENAMFRFLACFVACVFAASVLGRMIEAAPEPEEPHEGETNGGARAGEGVGGSTGGSVDGARTDFDSSTTADGGTGSPASPGSDPPSGVSTGTAADALGSSAANAMTDATNGGAAGPGS